MDFKKSNAKKEQKNAQLPQDFAITRGPKSM